MAVHVTVEVKVRDSRWIPPCTTRQVHLQYADSNRLDDIPFGKVMSDCVLEAYRILDRSYSEEPDEMTLSGVRFEYR